MKKLLEILLCNPSLPFSFNVSQWKEAFLAHTRINLRFPNFVHVLSSVAYSECAAGEQQFSQNEEEASKRKKVTLKGNPPL